MFQNGIDDIKSIVKYCGKSRVALVTAPTGLSRDFKSTVDILKENVNLVKLFAPEHGVRGDLQAGVSVDDSIDAKTKLQVVSLYGKNKIPSAEAVSDIDVFVFDIAEVGARFYTFLYTLANVMKSAAQHNKKVIVLDRLNPLGRRIEGNVLDLNFASFVGMYEIATRHGMTIGEYATFINAEYNINCDLEIVKLKHDTDFSNITFKDTNLLFVMPSPNLPSFESIRHYIGTCIFEGTNISEGRGTCKPFQIIGAPFIDGYILADKMNKYNLEGVVFRACYFTPTFSKHKDTLCSGVELHITNDDYDAYKTGIFLMYECKEMSNTNFKFLEPFSASGKHFIDYLFGSDKLRLADGIDDYYKIIEVSKLQLDGYKKIMSKYLLY